jgi:hypothetical protein
MTTRMVPPPDRFTVRRVGEPDHLVLPVVTPSAPETEQAPLPARPPDAPVPATVRAAEVAATLTENG